MSPFIFTKCICNKFIKTIIRFSFKKISKRWALFEYVCVSYTNILNCWNQENVRIPSFLTFQEIDVMKGDVYVIDSTWIRNSQGFLETDSNIHYYHHDISKEAISFSSRFHSYDANKKMPIFFVHQERNQKKANCVFKRLRNSIKIIQKICSIEIWYFHLLLRSSEIVLKNFPP